MVPLWVRLKPLVSRVVAAPAVMLRLLEAMVAPSWRVAAAVVLTAFALLPSAASVLKRRVPAATETPPVKVLVPVRERMPAPDFSSPEVPAMSALTVASFPVPSALTVIDEEPPERVRMFAALPLLSRIQLAAELVVVSPKTRLPIVRVESSRTVVSAMGLRVLKFAVKPAPEAMTLDPQLAAVDQV
jgi:hypothetical protein